MKIDVSLKPMEALSKSKSKRSAMLKMVMPLLGQSHGERLADAIEAHNVDALREVWEEIGKDLSAKLRQGKSGHGANLRHLIEQDLKSR
jgi:hypothetical protein